MREERLNSDFLAVAEIKFEARKWKIDLKFSRSPLRLRRRLMALAHTYLCGFYRIFHVINDSFNSAPFVLIYYYCSKH